MGNHQELRIGKHLDRTLVLGQRLIEGRTEGEPVFTLVPAPTDEALHAVLHKIITRMMKLLTRRRAMVEE